MTESTASAGRPRKKTETAEETAPVMALPAVDIRTLKLRIVNSEDSSLVMHAWSQKAMKQMLDKQTKRASAGRAAKSPEEDYEGSLYRDTDGDYAFPSSAFKNAAVRAGTYTELKMTYLRGAFFVVGEMVKISGEPQMREDMVRVGQGTADIRYRAEFPKWEATLTVEYNARAISVEQVVNLFRVAGFSVGIGDWRPERDGNHGRFEVTDVMGKVEQ